MKKYEVWTENRRGEAPDHDYNIIDDENGEIKLHYSNSKGWSDHIHNQEIASMTNTGDNLIIKVNGVKKLELEYIQAHQLLTLLAYDTKQWKSEIRESVTIKQF